MNFNQPAPFVDVPRAAPSAAERDRQRAYDANAFQLKLTGSAHLRHPTQHQHPADVAESVAHHLGRLWSGSPVDLTTLSDEQVQSALEAIDAHVNAQREALVQARADEKIRYREELENARLLARYIREIPKYRDLRDNAASTADAFAALARAVDSFEESAASASPLTDFSEFSVPASLGYARSALFAMHRERQALLDRKRAEHAEMESKFAEWARAKGLLPA